MIFTVKDTSYYVKNLQVLALYIIRNVKERIL